MSLKENDRFYEQLREFEEEQASKKYGWKYWQEKPHDISLWDIHDFVFNQVKKLNQ